MGRINPVQLKGANLEGSFFIGVELTNADLSSANMKNVTFITQGPNLLNGANLSGADLSGAKLRGVNLEGANLTGANLTNANLSGADLTGVSFDQAITVGVTLSATTICPMYMPPSGSPLRCPEFG